MYHTKSLIMKKLIVIVLLAFFAVGVTSCVDSTETDPVIPEVQLDDQESGTGDEGGEEESAPPRVG